MNISNIYSMTTIINRRTMRVKKIDQFFNNNGDDDDDDDDDDEYH